MGKILLTCALALVFGFGGATGAVTAFHTQLQGAQGGTGLTGAPGPQGPAGTDGTNGADGARGPAGRPGRSGKPGKAAKAAPKPATNLGVQGCAGHSVQVITNATLNKAKRLQLTKKDVCIVH